MAILANLVQHVRGSRIRASELKSANRVQIVCILFLRIFTIHESYAYLLVYTILLRIERNNFLRKNSLEIWNIKYCGILFDLNLRFKTICIGCAKGKFGKYHSGIPHFWNGGDSKKKFLQNWTLTLRFKIIFFLFHRILLVTRIKRLEGTTSRTRLFSSRRLLKFYH